MFEKTKPLFLECVVHAQDRWGMDLLDVFGSLEAVC